MPPEIPKRTLSPVFNNFSWMIFLSTSLISVLVFFAVSTDDFLSDLFNKILPVANAYEQFEQLDDVQPAHEEPVPVDDLNLFPAENPKEDIFLTGFVEPHFGHSGFSSL